MTTLAFTRARKGTGWADGEHFHYRVVNGETGWIVFVFTHTGTVEHVEAPFRARAEAEAFCEEWDGLGAEYDRHEHGGKYREAVANRRAMQRLYPKRPDLHHRPIARAKHEWAVQMHRRRAESE